jgi:hypothetical protein
LRCTFDLLSPHAIGRRSDIVLVAQSLGGFTAAQVCARAAVRMLAHLCALANPHGLARLLLSYEGDP